MRGEVCFSGVSGACSPSVTLYCDFFVKLVVFSYRRPQMPNFCEPKRPDCRLCVVCVRISKKLLLLLQCVIVWQIGYVMRCVCVC